MTMWVSEGQKDARRCSTFSFFFLGFFLELQKSTFFLVARPPSPLSGWATKKTELSCGFPNLHTMYDILFYIPFLLLVVGFNMSSFLSLFGGDHLDLLVSFLLDKNFFALWVGRTDNSLAWFLCEIVKKK